MASCIAPITLHKEVRGPQGEATTVVPCGKCPPCLHRRAAGWTFRLSKEWENSKTAFFLTLTYDDDHLHWSDNGYPTLNRKDFPAFMKRLRWAVSEVIPKNEIRKIRYYAVGEYGGQTERPHMHAIVFDIPDIFAISMRLEKYWLNGHVRVDKVEMACIGYVTGYVHKTLIVDGQLEGDDREREFSLMSKGLGKQFLSDRVMKYYQTKQLPYLITKGGIKLSMPRYYKDKLYTEEERRKMAIESLKYLEELDMFQDARHENEYKRNKFRQHKRKKNLSRRKI